MSLRFTLAMARRESRSTRRRLALYVVAITLGVAALVAITSFRTSVTRAVRGQARSLLGADLVVGSRWTFPDDVMAVIDSLQSVGADTSRVTTFTSMALAPRSGLTRLVEVQATAGGYPFYGELKTDPPGLWTRFRSSREVLVDPAVLVQLDARPGDTLAIGMARFTIAGTVTSVPGDIGLRSVFAARVYIPARYVEETGLLSFGSLSYSQVYVKLADDKGLERLVEAKDSLFDASRVWTTTVDEYEEDLTRGLASMSSFLGLIGLVALLLGGVGVASGVHVFVSEKLDTAAMLRCLGARQKQTLGIYLAQAGIIGSAGAFIGVILGLIVQAIIPRVLRDFLPLEVPFTPVWPAMLAGFGVGLWTALLFALLPLLKIKDVAPLRALRRDYEPGRRRRDPWRIGTYAAFALTLFVLTLWQAPRPAVGVGFAVAAIVSALTLGLTAWALMKLTRRFFPKRARFAVRQGIANLFRPHNQTVAVTLAIGSGVFLIALVYVVQHNLLNQVTLEARPDRPNLVAFDVQPDQAAGVERVLAEHDAPLIESAPIVPARLVRLGDRTVEQILADTVGPHIPRWALQREYRHTYRDTLVDTEQLIEGEWFPRDSARAPGAPIRVSIEEDIAKDLRVGIGDRITWDFQGVQLESEIVNVRRVNWARFEPNFFFVFQPGALEDAPHTLVMLTHVDDPRGRAEIQRDLVTAFPNVSAIDMTVILRAIAAILGKIALAIRFMALFSIAAGVVILIGAISTSRYQRARESVLLKTLGARSRIIARMMATEYFALGSFAGLAGVALAAIGGWAAVVFLFELDFRLPLAPLIAIWILTALATTAIGMANSRDVLRRTPLAGMRDFAE